VNDVGTPIDTLVREYLEHAHRRRRAERVRIVEPVDGRFWLAVGERDLRVQLLPVEEDQRVELVRARLEFTDMVTSTTACTARAGDRIYLYGGADNNTYDSSR
jgi:hypothetical protein